jgi:hypothetical protein
MSIPAHRIEDDPLYAFEACTLPPALFTHRLHLSAGWSYLQQYGFPEGVVRFRERLLAYVAAIGAQSRYHETLTWAYMILMNEERVLRSEPGESFDAMIARRPDLLDHHSGAIMAVYSKGDLGSDAARRVLVLPRRA